MIETKPRREVSLARRIIRILGNNLSVTPTPNAQEEGAHVDFPANRGSCSGSWEEIHTVMLEIERKKAETLVMMKRRSIS